MVRVELPRAPRSLVPSRLAGAQVLTLESPALAGNPLGDPATRRVGVYVPPSGVTEGKPLLVLLAGFTGEGSHLAERPDFRGESEFQTFDRLVRSGACPEAVVVAPDALTSLGGSQYVNSVGTGRYADYIVRDVIPWAQSKFGTGAVGVLGQSSGGFGAIHMALEHPGTFTAVGSSAGDLAFDLTMAPDIPKAVRAYHEAGGPAEFLRRFYTVPGVVKGPFDASGAGLLMLALSACYSPRVDGTGGVDLPFDPETGVLDENVWARWLAFDPCVRIAEANARDALRRLRRLHLTASDRDEWFLDVAARRFAAQLRQADVPVVHEEFPGGHFDKRPRFEALFAGLAGALTDPRR
jgi:enterochelin esterase-like enzyme